MEMALAGSHSGKEYSFLTETKPGSHAAHAPGPASTAPGFFLFVILTGICFCLSFRPTLPVPFL
jgi:hypothetical protein